MKRFYITMMMLVASHTFFAQVQLNDPLPFLGNVTEFQISPDGTTVVYLADQNTDGVFELFAVPITGGTPIRLNPDLTADGDVRTGFQISPDNTGVVYRADQLVNGKLELFYVPITGGTSTLLNATLPNNLDVLNFVINASGTHVVYQANTNNSSVDEIFSVPLTGGTATMLYGDIQDYILSPDGNTVIYRGEQNVGSPINIIELFAIPITGGTAIQLNNTPVSGGDVQGGYQVSQDNARVIYRSDELADNFIELFSVPITGGAPTRLNTNLPIANGGGDIGSFAISQDSQTIIYLADQVTTGIIELFRVPINGGTPVRLNPDYTGTEIDVLDFIITPTGDYVIYRADQNGANVFELFSVPITGGTPNVLNLPISGIEDVETDYLVTSDGQRVIHRTDVTYNVLELYSTPITGGTPTKLNDNLVGGGDVMSFAITPNNQHVVFYADQNTNDVFELFVVPIDGGVPIRINSDLVTGGDIQSDYKINSDGNMIVYRADQDTDEEFELFSNSLSTILSTEQEEFRDISFTLYPNPTKNEFTIQNTSSIRIEQVTIYDLSGKRIRSYAGNDVISTASITSGLYYVRITTEQGNITKKLMIQ